MEKEHNDSRDSDETVHWFLHGRKSEGKQDDHVRR
jgi:hypothetical protein